MAEPRVLSLKDALAVAVTSNRDFLSRKEDVYLSALSLTKSRRDFGPVLGVTLGYLVDDGPYVDTAKTASATASVTKRMRRARSSTSTATGPTRRIRAPGARRPSARRRGGSAGGRAGGSGVPARAP